MRKHERAGFLGMSKYTRPEGIPKTAKPYIICCEPRVVLYGWQTPADAKADPPVLRRPRMIVRWVAPGLHGLAADGAKGGERITPAAEIQTIETKIEARILVSPGAVASIEAGPWS